MQEESKLAYQFALEVTKQLITLSTGIIAITATFTKDIFKRSPSPLSRAILIVCLGGYLLSIWYGTQHIQALTGSLEWAAIEQAQLPADEAMQANQRLAALYLSPTAPDSVRLEAGEQLSNRGVIVGSGAKQYAARQINSFFWATVLAMAYGISMLVQTRKAAAVTENGG